MKILYDYQAFSIQKYGGVSRVYVDLLTSLSAVHNVEVSVSSKFSDNYYVDKASLYEQSSLLRDFSFRGKIRIINALNKIYSRGEINNSDYDVFHPTYYDPYYIRAVRKPTVVVVHDMINELFPSMFSKYNSISKYKKMVMDASNLIVAISHNTKSDILKIYPDIDETKIHVIHHGYSDSLSHGATPVNVPEKYILFVGQRGLYKNFNNFLMSVKDVILSGVSLVCVGGGKFSKAESCLIRDNDLVDSVMQVNVSDPEMNYIYQNAICFVFPSLYEGFGLPLLESLANDCPIVCSDIPIFKEVLGSAGAYFDPNSIVDMRETIQSIVNDASLRVRYSKKGAVRINDFKINKASKQYLDAYNKIV